MAEEVAGDDTGVAQFVDSLVQLTDPFEGEGMIAKSLCEVLEMVVDLRLRKMPEVGWRLNRGGRTREAILDLPAALQAMWEYW